MSKKTVFTSITSLPPGTPRSVVLDFLHNHESMIDLNPLVVERHKIPPPAHAEPDEAVCAWYSITDKITYMPGVRGDITYTAAFNDLPNGIQTHVYAPMGTDIRERWTLNGTLPGEPPEPVELGIGAPAQGLYIREDVELRCNVLMAGFTKKTLKKAHEKVVEAIGKKAHLQELQKNGESTSHQSESNTHSTTQPRVDSSLRSPSPPPPPPKDERYMAGYIHHRTTASDSNLVPDALDLGRVREARMSAQYNSNSMPRTTDWNSKAKGGSNYATSSALCPMTGQQASWSGSSSATPLHRHPQEPGRTSSAPQIPPLNQFHAGTTSPEPQGRYRPLAHARQTSFGSQGGGSGIYDPYDPRNQAERTYAPQRVAEMQ